MGYGPPPLARDAWHEERLYWQRNPPKRPKGYVSTKEAIASLGMARNSLRRHMDKIRHIKRESFLWWNADDVAALKLAREMNGRAR